MTPSSPKHVLRSEWPMAVIYIYINYIFPCSPGNLPNPTPEPLMDVILFPATQYIISSDPLITFAVKAGYGLHLKRITLVGCSP